MPSSEAELVLDPPALEELAFVARHSDRLPQIAAAAASVPAGSDFSAIVQHVSGVTGLASSEVERILLNYRHRGHEEWLAERARWALVMLRDCTEVNPRKRGGVPVLKGSRFTLAQVLAEIAGGRSVSELAEDFDLDLEMIKGFLDGLAVCFDRPTDR